MTSISKNNKFLLKRPKIIDKKYKIALENKDFEIIKDKEMDETFYIKFIPLEGHYKDQLMILQIKTKYGSGKNIYYFPMNPPNIIFISKIYHPNVSINGTICADFIKNKLMWSPLNGFDTIYYCIISLLNNPNPYSPLNGDSAQEYIRCSKFFTMEKSTKKYKYKEEIELKKFCYNSFIIKAKNFNNYSNNSNILNILNKFKIS